jgi:enamine deaminase RidA (YjgF/YER057c/UK114 family)
MRASVPNPFFIAAGHDVPYRDAIQAGDFVFVSGQAAVDYDTFGAQHPGDMVEQSATALEQVEGILGHFDLTLDHVVKLNTYFVGTDDRAARTSTARQAAMLGGRAACAAGTVSGLVRDGLLSECDAIAVTDAADRRVSTRLTHDGGFPAAVSAGPLLFVSGHIAGAPTADTAAELDAVIAALAETLGEFGIGVDRLVKLTIQTPTRSVAAAVEALLPHVAPNAAVTSLVVPRVLGPGRSIAIDGIAVADGAIEHADGVVTCAATPLVFLSAQRARDTSGTGLPGQTAAVMDALGAALDRCGATFDDVVKHQLFYADWAEWAESVDVRARYVSQPLAAIAVGAGAPDAAALIQSDAIGFIERSDR